MKDLYRRYYLISLAVYALGIPSIIGFYLVAEYLFQVYVLPELLAAMVFCCPALSLGIKMHGLKKLKNWDGTQPGAVVFSMMCFAEILFIAVGLFIVF